MEPLMSTKPTTAAEYRLRPLDVVRSTCLYLATKLGDLLRDVVVVGGLVPSLLIDQERLESGDERHVGTVDLDVGLSLAILSGRRYEEVSARLRRAGFAPDRNDKGQPTSQRWRIDEPPGVTVDFLIGPSAAEDQGGDLRNIENDFAAIIAPGLPLAFRDAERVSVSGHTLLGEPATREVQVCGPGAYVVLKALALHIRGENKDAYDLVYVLRYFGAGVGDVAGRLLPLLDDTDAVRAIEHLAEEFATIDSLGPRRYAEFLRGGHDDDLQADARGLVLDLVERCRNEMAT